MGLRTNQTCHIYLASELTEVGNKLDSEEKDLITEDELAMFSEDIYGRT